MSFKIFISIFISTILVGCTRKLSKEFIPINDFLYKREFYRGKRIVKSLKLYYANGKEVGHPYYYEKVIPCNKIIIVETESGKSGVISSKGEMIIKPQYEFLNFVEKASYEKTYKCFGFKNLATNKYEPFVAISNNDCEDNLFVLRDSLYNKILFDTNGNMLDYIHFGEIWIMFDSDVAAIKNYKTNKIGFMNHVGDITIEPQYDNFMKPLNDKYWRVALSDKWGLLDEYGNSISDMKYDWIEYKERGVYHGTIDTVVENILKTSNN